MGWEALLEINGDSWLQDNVPACWPRTLLLVPDAVALAWAGMWFGLKFKGRIRAILGSLILVLFVPWMMTKLITTVMEPFLVLPVGYYGRKEEWERCLIIATLAPALLMDLFLVYLARSRLPQTFRQLAVRR